MGAHRARRVLTIGLVVFLLNSALSWDALAQSTPSSDAGTTISNGAASETRFADDAAQLLTETGSPSGWTPVSIRYYDSENSIAVFVELRNDTGTDQLAPLLYADLALEGDSFGQEAVGSIRTWVPEGESAFFQSSLFYNGALAIGDWDSETWFVKDDTYDNPEVQDTSRITVADGRITNETDTTVGEILFATAVHDSDGIFVGGCTGPLTGANIPPGKSIRVRNLNDDARHLPTCVTLSAGMASSDELGVTGNFTSTTFVAYISEP